MWLLFEVIQSAREVFDCILSLFRGKDLCVRSCIFENTRFFVPGVSCNGAVQSRDHRELILRLCASLSIFVCIFDVRQYFYAAYIAPRKQDATTSSTLPNFATSAREPVRIA